LRILHDFVRQALRLAAVLRKKTKNLQELYIAITRILAWIGPKPSGSTYMERNPLWTRFIC
jgi:hypothetical protein